MAQDKLWQGIGVSAGRACGQVWVLQGDTSKLSAVEATSFSSIDSEQELIRLQQAVGLTEINLTKYEQQVRAEQGEEFARIFTAHKLLLSDPSFVGEAQARIKAKAIPAEQAMQQVATEAITMLKGIADPYFQERAVDVQDVLAQLLQNLAGKDNAELSFPATGLWLVLGDELTPAQTISLPKERVLGFIVRTGGKTSHAAILARTYGIPAVVGVKAGWEELANLQWVELDGDEGWVRPGTVGITSAATGNDADSAEAEDTLELTTSQMILAANVGNPNDLPLVHKFKGQGVGLYRTEFLFMGDHLPSENEQVEAYSKVIAACAPYVTVIRTLDIGGDKKAPALQLPVEQNPFLGVRALRLCLQHPEIFRVQLRAIWRAAAVGPTDVMFPMVATLEELLKAKELLGAARMELVNEGYSVGELQVGIMIEIPAAAWNAAKLAKEVDFFSIGTNDLTQYMLAVDRENSALAELYQTYHPAVLGMIARVSAAAIQAGIWVGICGEAGGDSLLVPFFAALGIKELSMAPSSLPKVRRTLARLSFAAHEKQQLVEEILDCATAEEVVTKLKSI